MLNNIDNKPLDDLDDLCHISRTLIRRKKYKECETLAFNAMAIHPDAPQPHNLYGILLELEGMHPEAMRHFRAAWALAPTFLPARYNLDKFGTFNADGTFAIDESDCRHHDRNQKIKCMFAHFKYDWPPQKSSVSHM